MIRELLLDFYGTVVEDDDLIVAGIADRCGGRGRRHTGHRAGGGRGLKPGVREGRRWYAVPVAREHVLRSLETVLMHVGDSLRADVRGAHAAGIRAAWINRRGQVQPPDVPVVHEVADLSGLAGVIG
ncbi:HAD hydrolase-like protein [Micromonospora sp. NPDC049523]|uniref:HAD family hydrolase n=1 Tax=Micromonospora sp. NPDC049523 TaxID=3155921 RepID=UPI0034189ED5